MVLLWKEKEDTPPTVSLTVAAIDLQARAGKTRERTAISPPLIKARRLATRLLLGVGGVGGRGERQGGGGGLAIVQVRVQVIGVLTVGATRALPCSGLRRGSRAWRPG